MVAIKMLGAIMSFFPSMLVGEMLNGYLETFHFTNG
jgi:hypothetical protein